MEQYKIEPVLLRYSKVIVPIQIGSEDIDNLDGTVTLNVPIKQETVYKNICKGNMFLLDLETGRRGYYPGSKLFCRSSHEIRIYDNPNDMNVIYYVNGEEVEIVDVNFTGHEKYIQVKYNDTIGYMDFERLYNLNSYTLQYREE